MSIFDRFRQRPRPWTPAPLTGARLVEGKVAVVTGGGGTVGSAISRVLAAEGARVAVVYRRNETAARAVVGAIRKAGGEAEAWQADIRDEAAVRDAVRAIEERYGSADVLVNNASASPVQVGMRGFLDHRWSDYETYLDTVVKGAVHCTRAVLPAMIRRQSGRIINIGTTALDRVNAHLNPYVTAKGGLLGFTHSLAEEFGRYGITVNQVVPGWMWTADRAPRDGEAEPFRSTSAVYPGVAAPYDVAHAVAFLASDRARMITGVYLPVAAGQIMPSPMP